MTADWRATLERVAELLDGCVGFDIADRRRIVEAEVRLRGLLAEPQPHEGKAKRGPKPLHELKPHFVMPSIEAPFLAGGSALAEPQVNPSEAREPSGRALAEQTLVDFERDGLGHHLDNADADTLRAMVRLCVRRAGLLAEGEESREPDDIGPLNVPRETRRRGRVVWDEPGGGS